MDAQTAATLQLLARAFASSPTKYSVTVSPHPTRPDTYDILFSRPTAKAPESPSFVKLTLTERPSNDGERHFEGFVENQKWPIPFTIDRSGVLGRFPHDSIDVAWEHKRSVSRTPLWTTYSAAAR
ncbi:unspecified product [Leptomonas pyrrhocoris]|uniref:Unspecified product n=1 Tax=Leptomonas pyrrhocoris TaxID=157538 RepID=A0A0M9G004_LEPPY|nr:unspecified product [Leptomonas pyrrhocoris]XP_015657827.1 unspecified product [Leptomonas pyrrhocoris]KPA79387.1 unspecified product [Leptomonas pyrrhocoris]KPA79388.1 unspecified product [Leptomonas pyrrhocoris]|eukprot:XP_015657826.1 unspecified product [Leptomonas pyrrhocoris]